MKLSHLDYHLPKHHIANFPLSKRDHSKLMLVNKHSGNLSTIHFFNIIDTLTNKDVLVFNNSKVFPARLIGSKNTGGKIELLLTECIENTTWKCIYKGRVKKDDYIFINKHQIKVLSTRSNIATVKFLSTRSVVSKLINNFGKTPIPPYIKTNEKESVLRKQYQTVYAKKTGSIAAPTAGFHFTNSLINKIVKNNITIEFVTLHVGPGTFLPIIQPDISSHKMHGEFFTITKSVAKRLNRAKTNGKRIIAVGTTATRVLETCTSSDGHLVPQSSLSKLFIYPPYKFKFVDAMITNFHLPKSTLLALVGAFVSYPNTKQKFTTFKKSLLGKAYKEAIKEKYRFYSFGDSMFIY